MSTVALIIALVLPLANTYVWEGFQKLLAVFDNLPGRVKAFVAIVLPVLLNFGATQLGIPHLPSDLHGWTPDITLGILQGLVSLGIHEKQKQAATGVTAITPLFGNPRPGKLAA